MSALSQRKLEGQVAGSLRNGERELYKKLIESVSLLKLVTVVGDTFKEPGNCSPENVRFASTEVKERLVPITRNLEIGLKFFTALKKKSVDPSPLKPILLRSAKGNTFIDWDVISALHANVEESYFHLSGDELTWIAMVDEDLAKRFTGYEIANGMMHLLRSLDQGKAFGIHLVYCSEAHPCVESGHLMRKMIEAGWNYHRMQTATRDVCSTLMMADERVAAGVVRKLLEAKAMLPSQNGTAK